VVLPSNAKFCEHAFRWDRLHAAFDNLAVPPLRFLEPYALQVLVRRLAQLVHQ
jgi:hypothetical protein